MCAGAILTGCACCAVLFRSIVTHKPDKGGAGDPGALVDDAATDTGSKEHDTIRVHSAGSVHGDLQLERPPTVTAASAAMPPAAMPVIFFLDEQPVSKANTTNVDSVASSFLK